MVYYVANVVNAIPATLDVSAVYSPRGMVSQHKLDITRDCKVQFGAYVEASDGKIFTNTMKSRTHGCITLSPSGNWQGSTLCFNLETGKAVKRHIVTKLPMPDRAKDPVNRWGSKEHGKKYTDCVEFLNCRQRLFDWENKELGESLPDEEKPVYPDVLADIPGVVVESDPEDKGDAVTIPSPPSLGDQAESAIHNANLGKLTGVHGQSTGVKYTPFTLYVPGCRLY